MASISALLAVLNAVAIVWLIRSLRRDQQQNAAYPNHNPMPQIMQSDGCTDKFCVHGECLGHEPDWELVGTGLRIDKRWGDGRPKCCGKKMTSCCRVELRRCKKCKSCRAIAVSYSGIKVFSYSSQRNEFAFCGCCKKTRQHTNDGWQIPRDEVEPMIL